MVDDIEFANLTSKVRLLERQVDFLLKHLNVQFVDIPDETYPDVAALKRAGKIIDAIKLYRSYTNTGLAEAKTFVDNMPY